MDHLKSFKFFNTSYSKAAIHGAVQKANANYLLAQLTKMLKSIGNGTTTIIAHVLGLLESVSDWTPSTLPLAIDLATCALDHNATAIVYRGAEVLSRLYRIAGEAGQCIDPSQHLAYLEREDYHHSSTALQLIDDIANSRMIHVQIAKSVPRIVYFAHQKASKSKHVALELLEKLAANIECHPYLNSSGLLETTNRSYGTIHEWKLARVLVLLFPEKYALEVVFSAINSATKQRQYVDEKELLELISQNDIREVLIKHKFSTLLMDLAKDNNYCAARALVVLYKGQPNKLFNLIMDSGVEESQLPSELYGVIIATWTARASVTNHLR